MRRAALAVVAAGFLVGLGWILGRGLHGPAMDARLYGQGRHVAVQQHLDEAPAGFVFLAGDSQAELQSPAQRPCGLELVNGGVSGANAAAYADFLESLRFPHRARAAVLAIGTNDLIAKNHPSLAAQQARFESAGERILTVLMRHADRVVVAALPPIGRELDGRLDAGAIEPFTERLRAVCVRLGCRVSDPYAALRDGRSGFAKPGAMGNGLHLAAYRPVLALLDSTLCVPP